MTSNATPRRTDQSVVRAGIRVAVTFTLLFCSSLVMAQSAEESEEERLARIEKELRIRGKKQAALTAYWKGLPPRKPKNIERIIAEVPYLKDSADCSASDKRESHYRWLNLVAIGTQNKQARFRIVNYLASRYEDNPAYILLCLNQLPEYLSNSSKQYLADLLKSKLAKKQIDGHFIRLMGTANIRQAEGTLRAIISQSGVCVPSDTDLSTERILSGEWDAKLALARLGFEPEIRDVTTAINALCSENVSRSIHRGDVLRSLRYIRQPQAVSLLQKWFLESDDTYMIDSRIHRVSTAAAASLAQILNGDPVENYRWLKEGDEQKMREWMNTEYTPYKIDSASVNINGKIVNNRYIELPSEEPAQEHLNWTAIISYAAGGIVIVLCSAVALVVLIRRKKRNPGQGGG